MANKNQFDQNEAYRINIVGRHLAVTDAMKNHAREKLLKIERLENHIMDVQIVMDIQKLEHHVIITLKFSHFKIVVSASSNDMYASIDKAIHKLQNQMRRWKEKMHKSHARGISSVDMKVNVLQAPYDDSLDEINDEIDQFNSKRHSEMMPQIIGTEVLCLKTLTLDEAMMKISLSNQNFLLFRGEEDQKLKVIYLRKDGNLGIIHPE